MDEMNSPEFYSSFKAKSPSQKSFNESLTKSNQKQFQNSSKAKDQNQLNDENIDPNHKKSIEIIFNEYQNLIGTLKSNQYTIDILNSNISHLEKEFSKKDQLYQTKVKQLQKLKKINTKTTEAIKAQKHRTKKLKKSHHKNLSQLQEVQTQLQTAFEERLKSQQHKNQIYQQYKDLEEEYTHKMQQLQNSLTSQYLKSQQNESSSSSGSQDSANRKFNNLPPKQSLEKLRQQNTYEIPKQIQKRQHKIAQLQSQLQTQLEHRQNIKKNIQKITENIKSYEEEQYQHQVKIQNLQKQKSIFIKNEQKVQQKNDYLNGLLEKVQKLRDQLDQRCEEKYGLVKYLKEVEKEQKQMRKIRKIQVECEKEQALYRQEKSQQFAVLESEHDHSSPQNVSKQSRRSSQNHPSQSPQFRFKNQPDQTEQIQRFDTEARERLSNIIQKYQHLKQKRKH